MGQGHRVGDMGKGLEKKDVDDLSLYVCTYAAICTIQKHGPYCMFAYSDGFPRRDWFQL